MSPRLEKSAALVSIPRRNANEQLSQNAFGLGLKRAGSAWGGCDWHGGNVKVNVNQNININNTHINRQNYQQKSSGPRDQYERQLAA